MSQPRDDANSARSRTELTTRVRTKVLCFCKKCNGSLVDPRTKSKHASKYTLNNFDNNYQETTPSSTRPTGTIDNDFHNEIEYEMEYDPLPEINDPLSERIFLTKSYLYTNRQNFKG